MPPTWVVISFHPQWTLLLVRTTSEDVFITWIGKSVWLILCLKAAKRFQSHLLLSPSHSEGNYLYENELTQLGRPRVNLISGFSETFTVGSRIGFATHLIAVVRAPGPPSRQSGANGLANCGMDLMGDRRQPDVNVTRQ